MPVMPKQNILAFAKRTAAPPAVSGMLAQKRAQAKAPAAPVRAPMAKPPHPDMEQGPEEESEVHLHELVEEAAQAAEDAKDQELEDVIAGVASTGPEDVPAYAEDAAKWAEAAEAVGLGGAGEDMFDEPAVVTAYLYRMIGGAVKGLEIAPPPEMPDEGAPSDMSKPGAAAKAIQARAAAKAPPPAAGGAISAAPKAVPAMAKGSVPPPAAAPAPGAEGGDELKAMLDEAAQEAAAQPDPAIQAALQSEPPQEGAAPSWASDPDMWLKAEEAVKPHWESYPDPWVVVAHVFKKLGGEVAGAAAPAPAPMATG
jgi:hypothetical protein